MSLMEWLWISVLLLHIAASAPIRGDINKRKVKKIYNYEDIHEDQLPDKPWNTNDLDTDFMGKESYLDKPEKIPGDAVAWMSKKVIPTIEPHDFQQNNLFQVDGKDIDSMTENLGNDISTVARPKKKSKHKKSKKHGRKFKPMRKGLKKYVSIEKIPSSVLKMMFGDIPSTFSTDLPLDISNDDPPSDSRMMLEDGSIHWTPDQDRPLDPDGDLIRSSAVRANFEDESVLLSNAQDSSDPRQTAKLDFDANEISSTLSHLMIEGEQRLLVENEDQSSGFPTGRDTPTVMKLETDEKPSDLDPDEYQSPDLTSDDTNALQKNMAGKGATALHPSKRKPIEYSNRIDKMITRPEFEEGDENPFEGIAYGEEQTTNYEPTEGIENNLYPKTEAETTDSKTDDTSLIEMKNTIRDLKKAIVELRKEIEESEVKNLKSHGLRSVTSDHIMLIGMVVFTIWVSTVLGYIYWALKKVADVEEKYSPLLTSDDKE